MVPRDRQDPGRRRHAGVRARRGAGMTRTAVRWTPYDDATLLRLRDGEGLGFQDVAKRMPGRTASACEMRYYGKLKGARNQTRRASGPRPSIPAVSWRKRGAAVAGVVAAPADVASPALPSATRPLMISADRIRMPCLDGLRERAELQLRIDRQGLTAGFFGDPRPGRSALDERARAPAPVAGRPFSVAVSDG